MESLPQGVNLSGEGSSHETDFLTASGLGLCL